MWILLHIPLYIVTFASLSDNTLTLNYTFRICFFFVLLLLFLHKATYNYMSRPTFCNFEFALGYSGLVFIRLLIYCSVWRRIAIL